MKLAPKKFFTLSLLVLGIGCYAKDTPPPPPAGTPPPPGFPIDNGVFIMIFVGIIFSFLFLKKYINSAEKA